ncbi:hydroxysqualene dehydroxylase HpnE [Rhodospirillum centenum]|uniref:Hypothetical 44.6 kDa protein y4aB n=1 Tax=Rhodospirillum centenum (strain ATCC 51521 / SW) TaxID=414684 RepID=B6ISN0_RHOCS|nr:hydroxysqualene dehydroxylase HpnE [Rhodospirillum centenum]ACI98466.1 Hypothetical 44.6 kDa protein y4aB [Rhodospirillum centenum SW]
MSSFPRSPARHGAGADARIHVVGAGLAGLACATTLAATGRPVTLYEAATQAGGRCRSYGDARLGCRIDNGNHLILGANPETFRYLDRTGGRDGLRPVAPAAIPFHDLADGSTWTVRPGAGPLPLWLLDPARRVAGAAALPHLAPLRLSLAGADATVAAMLPLDTTLGRRLWRPLAVSILNTEPEAASARLLWSVLSQTLLKGEAACRPHIACEGLSEALVDPALAFLAGTGAELRFHARLRTLEVGNGAVAALRFEGGQTVALAPEDRVVLAVPAWQAADLLPGLRVPAEHRAILNAHFRLPAPVALPGGLPLLGLIGGTAEWLFQRGDVLSVTVSAADRLIGEDSDTLAVRLWSDVARALCLPDACPPAHRIVKEKRATFAATPGIAADRPGPRTALDNLLLAGDWTDTGLPATIEGAVLSGHRAAAILLRDQIGSSAAATRRPSASRTL